jgi:hypothetical protein
LRLPQPRDKQTRMKGQNESFIFSRVQLVLHFLILTPDAGQAYPSRWCTWVRKKRERRAEREDGRSFIPPLSPCTTYWIRILYGVVRCSTVT